MFALNLFFVYFFCLSVFLSKYNLYTSFSVFNIHNFPLSKVFIMKQGALERTYVLFKCTQGIVPQAYHDTVIQM